MKWRTLLLPVVAVLAFAPQAQSQTLIAQYFRCSTADEGEADFIMNEVLGDIYESHAEAGDIIGWGWIEHLTGGPWRRIATFTASDLTSAWDQWGSIVEAILEEHPNAWHRFNEICPSHDDYIWNMIRRGGEPRILGRSRRICGRRATGCATRTTSLGPMSSCRRWSPYSTSISPPATSAGGVGTDM